MTLRNKGKQNLRSRGAAMLLVLIAVAMCTIMALSFLAAQQPTAVVASNIDRKTQARAIAESALKMAIDYVNEDADWRSDKSSGTWMADIALDGGTFTLSGTDEGDGDLSDDSNDQVLLTVVATFDGVTHRVSARVTPGAEESSANRLAFVVGNGSSPASHDQAKQTLFESWGYTVTRIDDAAAQSTYDAAVAVNDVVYVSESVSSGSVNTKLRAVVIGVVNDEGYLTDSFGFTTSNSVSEDTTTAIDITNNSHPVTTGFSTGSLTILSSSNGIKYASSSIASGVTTLADRTGSNTQSVLMVADAGDTLHYGAAEGRRVMLGFDDDLDVSDLSSDGQMLVRQSLAWAAGGATPSGDTPTLLALYEFNEQAVVDPSLVGHWRLDEIAEATGAGGVSAGDKIEVKGSGRINSYNSSAGTYASQSPGNNAIVTVNSTSSDKFKVESSAYVGGDGYIGVGGSTSSVFKISGTLTGSRLVQTSDIAIATLSVPSGMPSSSGNFSKSSGNTTISSDVTYSKFTLDSSAKVTISGDVTMWVTGDFKMKSSSQLIIPDGSKLTLYTGDDLDLESSAVMNGDSSDPAKLTIYAYGEKHVDLKGSAEMAAIVYTNDDFHIKDSSHFYGIVLADEDVKVEGSAELHQDLAQAGFSAGGGVSSTFGYTSVGSKKQDLERDTAAMRFTLTEAMTVTSLTAYVDGGDDGGDLRMAIYDDNSGSPGSLLSETGKLSAPEDEWQWVNGSVSPLALSPGTYWLALSLDGDDNDARYRYQPGGGSHNIHHHSMNAADDGFNSTWGSSSGSYSRQLCIYASGSAGSGGGGGTMPDAVDETTTDNDGTYVGDATGSAVGFGDGGTAVQFDGDGDYLEIAHDSAYLLDRGSVGLHFYADSLGGEQALFSKDSSGNDNGGHLHLYADGNRLKAHIQTTSDDPYRTGATVELESPSGVLSAATWHHAMVTWGDGQFRLYLDGVLVDAADHLGGLGTTSGGSGNDEPIVIGAGSDSSGDQSATPITDAFTGRIDDVRIYDMPLDSGQAVNLAGGSDPGSRTAPGYVIPDTSGYDTPLDLLVYDTSAIAWLGGGGLQFTGDTLATSQTYATKLHDAIEANEAFAVELIFQRATPASTASPSRIVSYVDGPSDHNFMIGQDSSRYEARTRDSATSSNGTLSPEFVSSSTLASSGDIHLVLSYQDGEASVYIDGVLDASATVGGTLNNWDADHFLALAGAYTGGSHWQGTLKRVAIYDDAFNAIQAENVYNGDAPGSGESGVTGTGSVQWDELD